MKQFCIHLHLFQQEQLVQREETEIVNSWNKGGNLAIAPGEDRQSLGAVMAEGTQEQTLVPAEAAGQRQWCSPGISPPASVA